MIRIWLSRAACAVMLLSALPTQAATVSLISMHYSAAQPVPHIKYEGDTEVGDVERLQEVFDRFVACREECVGPDGGPVAVLSLSGPGGSYGTGLQLADFLRANHIATVVESSSSCYSACAFAFLGGAGFSPQETVGTYIDRVVEPGGILGFHAPFKQAADFLADMEQRGVMEAQGGTRSNLSIMVRELVKWNVDSEVIFFMVGKGPDESYDILGADDYYLTRTALPASPPTDWNDNLADSVRNACIRLLAYYDRLDPLAVKDAITSSFEPQGLDVSGKSLTGYHLSDSLLDVNHCSIVDETAASGDFEIALYMKRAVTIIDNVVYTDRSGPMLTFFNRVNGWSTIGTGGNPVKRPLQKGSMNHMFLPVGIVVGSLDRPGEFRMLDNRFYVTLPPPLALGVTDATIDNATRSTRVSSYGDVWVIEEVGNSRLFAAAAAGYPAGTVLDYDSSSEVAFVRGGTLGARGMPFSSVGLMNGTMASVVTTLIVKPAGEAPTQADLDTVREVQCKASLGELKLNC